MLPHLLSFWNGRTFIIWQEWQQDKKKEAVTMEIGRILPTEAAAILNVSPQFVRVAMQQNKYLTSDAYLLAGDILLNDGAHTATNLTDGAKSYGAGASNTTPVKSNTKVDVAHGFNKSLAGTYKVTASGLNLRAGAGTGKSILAVMENGEKVQCYGYYNDHNGVKWLYVVYKNIVGYASSKYLSK